MKLKGLLLPVASITDQQRQEMFTLMDRHYENMCWSTFSADLGEKHWVILLIDPRTEGVCGFSTQMVLDADVAGRPVKALFSGDTIVARERWGDTALSHVWGRLALSLIEQFADAELYWFLISKGYKTYRFLPLFFREFFPRHDAATPAWATTLIDALGGLKFPANYCPLTPTPLPLGERGRGEGAGVVRADGRKDRLRPGIAEVTAERLRDPHVRFFLERNPGHSLGDELCCLAPLTRANFTRAAYRVIGPEAANAGMKR